MGYLKNPDFINKTLGFLVKNPKPQSSVSDRKLTRHPHPNRPSRPLCRFHHPARSIPRGQNLSKTGKFFVLMYTSFSPLSPEKGNCVALSG
jgi:hypothetical protein